MKIFVLDGNTNYSQRFKYYMNLKYPDLQITTCDNLDAAKDLLGAEGADFVMFDSEFDKVTPEEITDLCGEAVFCYFSETNEIVNNTETIFKYRGVSALYSKICFLYESKKNRVIKKADVLDNVDKKTKIITFLPVHGGAGSSTVAACTAVELSKENEVLYINLEQTTSDAVFFESGNNKSISDFLALFKTKYSESSVYQLLRDIISRDKKQKSEMLSYIKGFTNMNESLSLSEQALSLLLQTLVSKFEYSYIIIDADFSANPVLKKLIFSSDRIVFVSTDSDLAISKISKLHRYMDILQRDVDIMPQQSIVLNQYYGLTNEKDFVGDMDVLARIVRYRTGNNERLTSQSIIQEVVSSGVLSKLTVKQEEEAVPQ